jgi:hypothetical protein
VFRRATREIRVSGGLLLIVGAVIAGVYELSHATGRADRDFALCSGIRQAPDCAVKRRPVRITLTPPGDDTSAGKYELDIKTRPNVTMSLLGLTGPEAAPWRGVRTTEIRYRQGRLVAVVAPDGTTYEFPFAFTKELVLVIVAAVLAGLLGLGSLAWGLTRVNRTPRA